MQSKDGKSFKAKVQMIPVTLAGLISSALNGIIAYIAVYFFKPMWEKLVRYFAKK